MLTDFDELNETDIYSALSFAVNRDNKIYRCAL